MPKTNRETIQKFNNRMIKMYPNVLDIEASILFCKLCQCNINGNKVFGVHQHFRTLKHRSALELGVGVLCSGPTTSRATKLNTFSLDLCTTFLESNIPLEAVENPSIQMFFEKYTNETIPNETILRVEYVPALYEKYIQKLQHKAKSKLIWISITESIDCEQHLIAYFVFGLLEEYGKSYLLNIDRLERANASSFAAFFNHSLQSLWPEKILYENVYLVVTDAIPYMMKALQSLKILYPNMIYLNCLLQAFKRLVDFIRIHFSNVDKFIINCEAVFLKSPHRLHLMRSKYNYLNIPPLSPSTATASTWLNVAIYYCSNYTEISSLLDMLSLEDDAECIKQARELLQNTTLETDLVYIKHNFECLSQAIVQLDSRDLTLNESLRTVDLVKTAIYGTKRTELINKFEQIVNENSGLEELTLLNKYNNSSNEHKANNLEKNNMLYKNVPIVSANNENLSYAKSLLENYKKKMFNLKNLKKEIDTHDNDIFDPENIVSQSQLRASPLNKICIKHEFFPQGK